MQDDDNFIDDVIDSQKKEHSDFLESFLYDCGRVVPYRYGNSPALTVEHNDYLYDILEFIDAWNTPLVDIVQTIADSLRSSTDFVKRTPYAYIVQEGNRIDNVTQITLKMSSGCLHIGYRYWANNVERSALEIQNYLKLFFSFTRNYTIFHDIALEGILHSLEKCVKNPSAASRADLHGIFNRLNFVLRRPEPPDETGHAETRHFILRPLTFYELRYYNYRHYIAIVSKLIRLRNKSNRLRQIHDNLLDIGNFLTIRNPRIDEIIQKCCLLRRAVTLIEIEIFNKFGLQYNENDSFPRLINRLYENGRITIEAKNAAAFSYSLLSWAIHGESYCDFDEKAKVDTMYLMDALRTAYNLVITGLFPEIDKMISD